MGLVVGIAAGFFRASYWETVLYGVLIGAVLGIGANALAWLGALFGRRRH